jgi:hypothetical protein
MKKGVKFTSAIRIFIFIFLLTSCQSQIKYKIGDPRSIFDGRKVKKWPSNMGYYVHVNDVDTSKAFILFNANKIDSNGVISRDIYTLFCNIVSNNNSVRDTLKVYTFNSYRESVSLKEGNYILSFFFPDKMNNKWGRHEINIRVEKNRCYLITFIFDDSSDRFIFENIKEEKFSVSELRYVILNKH